MEGGGVEGGRLPEYLQWWGKAQPADLASPSFHPIAYHSLDVAAVVRATLRSRAGARRRASRLLGVGDDDAIALCTALAALHDLGKFGNAFQVQTPELIPGVLLEPESRRRQVPGFSRWLTGVSSLYDWASPSQRGLRAKSSRYVSADRSAPVGERTDRAERSGRFLPPRAAMRRAFLLSTARTGSPLFAWHTSDALPEGALRPALQFGARAGGIDRQLQATRKRKRASRCARVTCAIPCPHRRHRWWGTTAHRSVCQSPARYCELWDSAAVSAKDARWTRCGGRARTAR